MTGYERHAQMEGHNTTFHAEGSATIVAPDMIEECSLCGQRWLHNQDSNYPRSLMTRIEIETETNNLGSFNTDRLIGASMSQYSVECASAESFDEVESEIDIARFDD